MFIEADTHIHTIASTHAYSTVLEIATEAARKGLKAIAITDHTPGESGFSQDAPHIWHFHNLHKALPRELCGVKLIYGAEASINGDGTLDFPMHECENLDWVIASVHGIPIKDGTFDDYTDMYLKIAEHPLIDVIGHPATVRIPFDYEKCIRKFKEYGKLVEVNESLILWKNGAENYKKIIEVCKKLEAPVVVNTDAHFCGLVGDVTLSQQLLEEQNFPKKLIINSDWDVLKEYINMKRGKIF